MRRTKWLAGQPPLSNLYAFCADDPADLVDVDGLDPYPVDHFDIDSSGAPDPGAYEGQIKDLIGVVANTASGSKTIDSAIKVQFHIKIVYKKNTSQCSLSGSTIYFDPSAIKGYKSKKGCAQAAPATMLVHEIGHSIDPGSTTGDVDAHGGLGPNITNNEVPFEHELGLPERTAYGDCTSQIEGP